MSKTYGVNLSLAQWMSFGVPVAAVLLVGCWLLLYFTLLRGAPAVANLRPMMQSEYAKLGGFTRGETITTLIFIGCVQAWVFSDFWSGLIGANIDDAVIALDLEMGAKRWVRQTLANDVSIGGCALFLPEDVPPLQTLTDPNARQDFLGATKRLAAGSTTIGGIIKESSRRLGIKVAAIGEPLGQATRSMPI